MSDSRKKNPITGFTTAKSEKQDKRIANRRLRKKEKIAIYNDDELMPIMAQISNSYGFSKDGKQYVNKHSNFYEKALRK